MTFDEYYRNVYLPVHTQFGTRLCHLLGNLLTIAWVVWAITLLPGALGWFLLLCSPLVIYPVAIPSHYIFEGGKPAVLGGNMSKVSYNPLKAKYSDWRMCLDWLCGRL